MSPADRVEVFRCERCERRFEQPEGSPAPTCGEYAPGTRQRFPDGSWIHLGEGYTPHTDEVVYVETLDANPLAGYRDDTRRAARLEAERPAREADFKPTPFVDLVSKLGKPSREMAEPAGVTHIRPKTVKCPECKELTAFAPSTMKQGEVLDCGQCGKPIVRKLG